jgi:predicted transcriptional regulator
MENNNSEALVLTNNKKKKDQITYLRLTEELKYFVDSIAQKLEINRSEAIRKILQVAKSRGIVIKD